MVSKTASAKYPKQPEMITKATTLATIKIIFFIFYKYLMLIIKSCRNIIKYISKKLDDNWAEEYICISIEGTSEAVLPRFLENTQFKNMERDRKYTLEELGL